MGDSPDPSQQPFSSGITLSAHGDFTKSSLSGQQESSLGTLRKFDAIVVPEPAELSEGQKEVLQTWENIKGRKVYYVTSADDIKAINPGAHPVKVSGPPNIWVLPRLRSDSPLVCHILNRNYDAEKDSIVPARDVEVILGAPLIDGENIGSCKLISPDRDVLRIDAELRGDKLHVPISELGMWSLLVIE